MPVRSASHSRALNFPFAPLSMRQRFNVTSELAISGNYQERPEYTRIISGAAWKYKWVNRTNTRRHEFDLIDINYVYLPERTNDFPPTPSRPTIPCSATAMKTTSS